LFIVRGIFDGGLRKRRETRWHTRAAVSYRPRIV
jgi:hypothetical protein